MVIRFMLFREKDVVLLLDVDVDVVFVLIVVAWVVVEEFLWMILLVVRVLFHGE
jgi:hypothetical protein